MLRRTIKIAAAGIAFVPALVLLMRWKALIPDSIVVWWCELFNFPAFSIAALLDSYQLPPLLEEIILGGVILGWSLLIAMFCWKFASCLLGENEPNAKFDWVAFQVRFFVGAIFGALLGWRIWIRTYNWSSLVVCMIVGALVCGTVLGVGWRDYFRNRGF